VWRHHFCTEVLHWPADFVYDVFYVYVKSTWMVCQIVGMCAFIVFLDGACARVPCVVIVHLDFITGCIVLDLLEMIFW
jgi:hypothetical protein